MKDKKGFKQLTIEQMKAKKQASEISQLASQNADEFAYYIDEQTDLIVVELIRELGFEVSEGMTAEEAEELHQKMKESGQYINIQTKTVESKYVVTIEVVQVARTIEFELGN